MELLHHYSTCSCVRFAPDNVRHKCWTTDVPRLALAHGFLLHQILAVAALHCYVQDPNGSRHLAGIATSHRALALELVKPALQSDDSEVGIALFAFAGLTAIYAFGELAIHLKDDEDDQHTINHLIACFRLTRGISTLVQAHQGSINGSWAEAMINLDADEALQRLRKTGLRFDQARILNEKIEEQEQLNESEDKTAYLHAATRCLENIQLLLSQRLQGETTNDDFYHLIMSWPNDISDQVMQAIEAREPLALVIIAHFAVLMSMHTRQWWLNLWPERVLADVGAQVGPQWTGYLEWPWQMLARSRENGHSFSEIRP